MTETFKSEETQNVQYPSAELLQQACYDDYRRLLETYDKIYEKVNIMLAFCGVVLLVVLGNVDYTRLFSLFHAESNSDLFILLLIIVSSVVSSVCVVWAVVQLLLLMRSRSVLVFNSIGIRDDKIYLWKPDQAAVWLIDKYTIAINSMRNTIQEKQKSYDSAITKVIVSLISHAIVLVIEKGL